jgi:hypothetical protein
MRRTRMMLAAVVVTLSLSTAGTGVALAQTDNSLQEECAAMSFFEWLLFGHQCHGHGGGPVYWPAGF